MQIILALMISITMQTPMDIFVAPNGECFGSIECTQCGDWYIPTNSNDLTCPCDWED